jgi:hypothetical protein
MKIRMTKYGHAITIAILGIVVCKHPWVWSSFIGGLMVGFSIKLAIESGEENGRN